MRELRRSDLAKILLWWAALSSCADAREPGDGRTLGAPGVSPAPGMAPIPPGAGAASTAQPGAGAGGGGAGTAGSLAGAGSGGAGVSAPSAGGAGAAAPMPTPDPVADAEDVVCYDLTVHGSSSPTDTSPFQIPAGESYHCFYFDAPWGEEAHAVAFRSKLDNETALHHWFLYAMPAPRPHGTVESCLPLHVDEPKMLAGWAPGGKDMAMPQGVAAETAPAGSTLMLEWHYFNNTAMPLADRSAVTICTVAAGRRPNVAAVSWLGTEDFGLLGIPPGVESSYTGTCEPSRLGVGEGEPIHLLYTIPHMHRHGRHMKLEIERADGSRLAIFDRPFSEADQAFVETPAEVFAGDKLLTTCVFENTSATNVAYGSPFGNGEMCYGFVLHYPAHALDNGSSSLLGASNACL